MNYILDDPRGRLEPLSKKLTLGLQIIIFILGLGSLSEQLKHFVNIKAAGVYDDLQLGLLCCTLLLVLSWIAVSEKELQILRKWLELKGHQIPDEYISVYGLAIVLATLILATKNSFYFGIVYVIYSFGNLLGWVHLKNEVKKAVTKSRCNLKKEEFDPVKVGICSKAMDLIEDYYVRCKHIARASTQFGVAVLGFMFAIYGKYHNSERMMIVADIVFIVSMLIVEGIIIFRWRVPFYHGIKELLQKYDELPASLVIDL